MNSVTLTGRLQADPDLHYDSGGQPTATMRLTVVDRRDTEHGTVTIEVLAYGSRAHTVARHLREGRLIGIEGRLVQASGANQHRHWHKHQVIATSVDFLDPQPHQRPSAPSAPGLNGQA